MTSWPWTGWVRYSRITARKWRTLCPKRLQDSPCLRKALQLPHCCKGWGQGTRYFLSEKEQKTIHDENAQTHVQYQGLDNVEEEKKGIVTREIDKFRETMKIREAEKEEQDKKRKGSKSPSRRKSKSRERDSESRSR